VATLNTVLCTVAKIIQKSDKSLNISNIQLICIRCAGDHSSDVTENA